MSGGLQLFVGGAIKALPLHIYHLLHWRTKLLFIFVWFRFDLRNDDKLYMASSDGTVSYTDIVTGLSSCLLDLNPNGWHVIIIYLPFLH